MNTSSSSEQLDPQPPPNQVPPPLPDTFQKQNSAGRLNNISKIMIFIILGIFAISGWVGYMVENKTFSMISDEITKKTEQIKTLNTTSSANTSKISELTAANEKLSKDLLLSEAIVNDHTYNIDHFNAFYQCADISADKFNLSSRSMTAISFGVYIRKTYPKIDSVNYIPLGENIILYKITIGDALYSYIVFLGQDSNNSQNRIFFVNEKCFIEK